MTDQQAKDLQYIQFWENEISYMHRRYSQRMAEKSFEMADQINEIIKLYEKELSNAKSEYSKDYPSQIPSSPTPRDKTVFIVED